MCYQFLHKKYNFYHQDTFLDAFPTNSRNIIGRNPSMVIPLLANQDLTPMLGGGHFEGRAFVKYTLYKKIYQLKLSKI